MAISNLRRLWCKCFGHRRNGWHREEFDPQRGVRYTDFCKRCGDSWVQYRDEVISPPSNVPISCKLRGPLAGWWDDVIYKHHGDEPDFWDGEVW